MCRSSTQIVCLSGVVADGFGTRLSRGNGRAETWCALIGETMPCMRLSIVLMRRLNIRVIERLNITLIRRLSINLIRRPIEVKGTLTGQSYYMSAISLSVIASKIPEMMMKSALTDYVAHYGKLS